MDTEWHSAITNTQTNHILVRGYPVHELMGRLTYAEAVYLVLKGELPTARQRRLIDAMLVCAVDHGVKAPSAKTARMAATSRPPLLAAVAAGMLAITEYHGGAIEGAMRAIAEVDQARAAGMSVDEAARAVVKARRQAGVRIPGFGHRVHTVDPRTQRLFAILGEDGEVSRFVGIVEAIQRALEAELNRPLPINVDGAMAAVLCELGFPAELANGFFAISRLPGLIAHVYEEMSREKPVREIDFGAMVYDGPAERHLDGE